MSVVGGPLEKIGKYLDLLIKEMVSQLKSFVKDTADILRKLQDQAILEGTYLVGIDVEKHSTHPCVEGPETNLLLFGETTSLMGTQNEFIVELLEFILENNYFQFNGK